MPAINLVYKKKKNTRKLKSAIVCAISNIFGHYQALNSQKQKR